MAATAQVCGVIDALSDFQQKIIDAVNGKFAALRRLAELLERLSDLTGFIPDITALVPISAIDISIYETLRAECPFLNLPPASGDPEQVLGELRARLNTAYGRLLGQLDLHPLSRMSKLQDKIDEYQQRFNLAALGGTDFMQCLQAACQAAVAVEGTVSNLSSTSPNKVVESASKFLKNTVTDQGRVLGEASQNKVNDWRAVRDGVADLMDVEVIDLPTTTA